MPNPFSINVVTADGSALIAQATAANPIVFIGAKSTASASPTAADLAGKTSAFYDGADGEISACSATGNVAKIVVEFTNTNGAAQAVKSVCVLGKLANAPDSEAVIVAAMSDENSAIVLPPSTAPTAIIWLPFNINVGANDTIETVYADGATISDLDRFVSMYKAGDPTQGDDQTILGDKTFSGAAQFTSTVAVTGALSGTTGSFSGTLSANLLSGGYESDYGEGTPNARGLSVDDAELTIGMLGEGFPRVRVYYGGIEANDANNAPMFNIDSTTGNVTIYGNLTATSDGKSASFRYLQVGAGGIDISGDLGCTGIVASGNAEINGKITVDGGLSVDGGLTGVAPELSDGTLSVPVGGVCAVVITSDNISCLSVTSGLYPGVSVDVTQGSGQAVVKSAVFEPASTFGGGGWNTAYGTAIPDGTYTVLCGFSNIQTGESCMLLLIRTD